MTYGLVEIDGGSRERKQYYIYQGEPSMKNWIAIVEFELRSYRIIPFQPGHSLGEKIALCILCADKANELCP